MKNTMLWSTLFTFIGTQVVYADISPPLPTAPNNNTPTMNQPTAPNPTQAAPNIPDVSSVKAETHVINCSYQIPAETQSIDQSLVITWSEKALTQAFDFDPNNIETQLQKLQACFTEQGWTGFNAALQKSGNIDAIKSKKLTVSSQIDGQVIVTEAKNNQWKINLPLQVVYQNDKEKVTQLLSVDLTVGRKTNGDLGITQMIAAPRGAITQEPSASPATNPSVMSNDHGANQTITPGTQPASPPQPSPTSPSTTIQPTPSQNHSASPPPTTPGEQAQPTLPSEPSSPPPNNP
jgi:hypothetical protein